VLKFSEINPIVLARVPISILVSEISSVECKSYIIVDGQKATENLGQTCGKQEKWFGITLSKIVNLGICEICQEFAMTSLSLRFWLEQIWYKNSFKRVIL
jgi:hypothetical protein